MSDLRTRVLGRLEIQPDGCVLWTGARSDTGYGQAGDGGRVLYVHRLMYEWFVDPIPPSAQIDHLCRVRHCAAPAHLEAVPRRENILRGQSPAAINAAREECTHGHPFDDTNTQRISTRPHVRRCRICHNSWRPSRGVQ